MIHSRLFQFIFGSVLGCAIAFGIVGVQQRVHAAPAPEAKPCAQVILEGKNYGNVSQQGWDLAQEALRRQKATIDRLNEELAQAKQSIVSYQDALKIQNTNLAHASGVLQECAQSNTAFAASAWTVLYESGRSSVNVSLLPLPGAPRVALSPNSELQPRWIVPGRIQPQIVGETRKAIYYYLDAQSSSWQGPFAPERVAQ